MYVCVCVVYDPSKIEMDFSDLNSIRFSISGMSLVILGNDGDSAEYRIRNGYGRFAGTGDRSRRKTTTTFMRLNGKY